MIEDRIKQILSADSKRKQQGLTFEKIFSEIQDGQLFGSITENEVRKHINQVLKENDGYITKSSKRDKGKIQYKLRQVRSVSGNRKRSKPETDVADTSIIGKAGEMAVLSELLYRGYTANTMIVDKGIDIVASLDNKFYYIQVKTTYLDERGKCSVSISRDSFERVGSLHNVSYIIVVRTGIGEHSFFVFTQNQLEHWIDDKYINKTDSNINIGIMYDEIDKLPYVYYERHKVKVSSYLNNFKLA